LCLHDVTALAATTLQQAGVSAAVRGQVQRASDTQPVGVQVVSGQPIYLADRISSGTNSGLQIMLLDQTTFTIGPDSFVKIDEFVYDPSTNVGKVTASLGKGVFRFVTGKIALQNPSNMTVKLPLATIGIRGTMVYGRSDENGAVVGLAGAGPNNNTGDRPAGIDVITPQGTAEVRRPGWGVSVVRGQPPVVQKLPKPLVDAILNGVAPRDLVNAVTTPTSTTSAAQASTPASANNANKASGQSSASAGPTMATFQTGQSQQTNNNQFELTAVNSPGSNGINSQGDFTTFEQLRAITTGSAYYVQTGVPLVGPGDVGSYNFSLTINFATQTGTGVWSNINFDGAFFVENGQISFDKSYAGKTGPVTGSFGANQICGSGITCIGTLNLFNANGITAAQAAHSLTLSDGNGNTASGSGTAQRQQGNP
jgi:hypothetical protein